MSPSGVTWLFLLAGAGLVAWQLVTGTVIHRYSEQAPTREDTPGKYWLFIAGQCAMLVAAFFFLPRDDEARHSVFELVSVAAVVVLGAAGYYVLDSGTDAALKRTMVRLIAFGTGAALVGFVWYEGFPLPAVAGAACVAVFLYLALGRAVSFCTVCGKPTPRANFWSPARVCARCGVGLPR